MKTLNTHQMTASNAWGKTVTQTLTRCELEPSDVGITLQDIGGMGYRTHVVTRADIGRTLTRYTSPGHRCIVLDPITKS